VSKMPVLATYRRHFMVVQTKIENRLRLPGRQRTSFWLFGTLLFIGGVCFLCNGSITPTSTRIAEARYLKSIDILDVVSDSMDRFKTSHGRYPTCPDFSAMVSQQSPLVQEGFLPPHITLNDPYGNPFTGSSGDTFYRIGFSGDPSRQQQHPPIVREGRITPAPTNR